MISDNPGKLIWLEDEPLPAPYNQDWERGPYSKNDGQAS